MTFLQKLCSKFEEHKIEYALVGGFAVALHGVPRGTIDIDIVICLDLDSYLKCEQALKELGMKPRLPVSGKDIFNFRREYIENRNLTAWSFYDPNNLSNLVDIIITEDLNKFSTKTIRLESYKIKILSKHDLIKIKAKSGRLQDLNDIEALKKI